MRQQISAHRRAPVTIGAGGWTFFNDPRAIAIGGETFAGSVNGSNGDCQVASEKLSAVKLHSALQVDDHCNPGLLRRSSDGKILALYSRHSVDNHYYQRLSTNADDLSSWGPEVDLGAILTNATNFTYANLVEIDAGIFNMLRCVVDGAGTYTGAMMKTTDGGANWKDLADNPNKVTKIFNQSGQRSYNRICRRGSNRIDIICNNGHPAEYRGNSIYHFYYDGDTNTFRKSDGAPLSLPVVPSTDLTGLSQLWDGSTVQSWCWGIEFDGTDLAGVFATFPTPSTDHRYQYARWNGASWDVNEICNAGGSIYPVGNDSQLYYSGGICIDPDDVNIIYCSRETGSGGIHRNGGTYQLWRGLTRDGGRSWYMTQITFGSEDCFRPYKPRGGMELVYLTGTYDSYTNFDAMSVTKIAMSGTKIKLGAKCGKDAI